MTYNMFKNILTLFLLFISLVANAQVPAKEYNTYTVFPTTTAVVPTTLYDLQTNTPNGIRVYDSEPGLPNQVNQNPYSYLALNINTDKGPFEWYEARATFEITPLFPNGSADTAGTFIKELMVSYNPNGISSGAGTEYSDLNYLQVKNRYGLIVKVVPGSIQVTKVSDGTAITLPTDNIFVSMGFKVNRYYSVSNQLPSPTAVANPAGTSLTINWAAITGALEYEVEWTWVDNYSGVNLSSILQKNEINFTERNFELNNTRVTTNKKTYEIPLIYSKGYLIYRVRAVGRNDNASYAKTYGIWSSGYGVKSTVNDWPHIYQITAEHEAGKNWQFQASYAEEGKKKEVVSYFDGSLRNRQTVTKVNSDNNTVVGEVIYDAQGRPAIEVLPTPTLDPTIHFFNNYNLNPSNTPYRYPNFDYDSTTIACQPEVSGMSNTSGSSKYYSQNSDFLLANNQFAPFTPNAEKFPFSQIEYTPDNTGRIARKGGVGPEHKLGKHEMTYFYGTPTDKELNRLFGYSVGNVSHYKKNTVVDPNGQASVSYLDPQGRTIATALSGPKPASNSLDGLPDEAIGLHGPETAELLTGNNLFKYSTNFPVNNDQLVVSKTFNVVGTQVTHKVNYTLNQNGSTYASGCGNYPFVFDLNLNLKNQCGISKMSHTAKIGPASVSGAVPSVAFDSGNFPLDMDSYSLTKELMVNKDALNAYADDYVVKLKTSGSGCYVDPLGYSPKIDINLCGLTCASCVTKIGLIQTYVELALRGHYNNSSFIATPSGDTVTVTYNNSATDVNGAENIDVADLNALIVRYAREWHLLEAECKTLCEPTFENSCKTNESILLSDVTPLGQYGATAAQILDTATNLMVDNPDFKLSVFNSAGVLFNSANSTVTGNSWRAPVTPYRDADGVLSYVTVEKLDDGTYNPPIIGTPITVPALPGGLTTYKVLPEKLEKLNDFVLKWNSNPNWAYSLLPYHPEYQYYIYNNELCKLKKTFTIPVLGKPPVNVDLSSDGYDDLLMKTATFAEANAIGLIGSDFSAPSIYKIYSSDPYFQALPAPFETTVAPNPRVGINSIMYQAIVNDYLKANEGNLFQTAVKAVLGNPLTSNVGFNYTTVPSDLAVKNRIWSTYKSMYVSFKSKIKQMFMNIYAMEKKSYNGCIGGDVSISVTNVLTDNFAQKATLYNYIHNSIVQTTSLCASTSGPLYKVKQKRYLPADFGYNSAINPSDAQAELVAAAGYDYYMQTGNCPLMVDLDMLLNGFFTNANVQAGNATAPGTIPFAGQYLSKAFLSSLLPNGTITEGTAPSYTDGTFPLYSININTSVLTSTLTLKFTGKLKNGAVDYTTAATKITVPSTYSWSNYKTAWKITNIKQLYYDAPIVTPGIFKFKAIATIEAGGVATEVLITGETTAKIGECSASNNGIGDLLDPNAGSNEDGCDKKYKFRKALIPFLNQLKALNQINSTAAINLNSISTYTNSYLAEFFGANTIWVKDATAVSPDMYYIKNGTTTLATFKITLPTTFARFEGVVVTQARDKYTLKLTTAAANGTIVHTEGAMILPPNYNFDCCVAFQPCMPNDFDCDGVIDADDCVKKHIAFVFDLPHVDNYFGSPHRVKVAQNILDFMKAHRSIGSNLDVSNQISLTTVDDISGQNGGTPRFRLINYPNNDSNDANYVANTNPINTTLPSEIYTPTNILQIQEDDYNSTIMNINTSLSNGTVPLVKKIDVVFYLVGSNIDSDLAATRTSFNSLFSGAVANAGKPFFVFVTHANGNVVDYAYNNPPTVTPEQYLANLNITPSKYIGNNAATANYAVFTKVQTETLDTTHDLQELIEDIYSNTPIFADCYVSNSTGRNMVAAKNNPGCETCVPQPVVPIPCGTAQADFLTFLSLSAPITVNASGVNYTYYNSNKIAGYTVDAGEFDDFCIKKYQYILASYMEYITTMGITSTDNVHFLTISEFGDTYLNYGFTGMTGPGGVIQQFKTYYNDYFLNPLNNPDDLKKWNAWVNKVFRATNMFCPPAPIDYMSPILPADQNETCATLIKNINETYSAENYNNLLQTKRKEFIAAYIEQALQSVSETLNMTYFDQEYQYTLYYYDQAGNLTQTVAPKGVKRFTNLEMNTKNALINNFRTNFSLTSEDTSLQPDHKYNTQYRYNSLNQLVYQNTPDGGITRFAYDYLGRIIASQNANQVIVSPEGYVHFSYTTYDALGRITEAGQVGVPAASNFTISPEGRLKTNGGDAEDFGSDAYKTEVTKTIYDEDPAVDSIHASDLFTTNNGGGDFFLNNRNRVTGIFYYEDPQNFDFDNAIFYNYDVHGNVKEVVNYYTYLKNLQCTPGTVIDPETGQTNDCEQHLKRIVYNYDLISGNVNQVVYQPNKIDQFIHKYNYDADNRILNVETSVDGIIWEKDADYKYYAHGPLARVELGNKKVQGIDYAYTLQGWLKTVNGENITDPANDLGQDGLAAGTTKTKDAFGYSLSYFAGDYHPVVGDASFKPLMFSRNDAILSNTRDLYNGNIKQMTTAIRTDRDAVLPVQKNNYTYDQLNRITGMTSKAIIPTATGFSTFDTSYSSTFSYDRNGNLETLSNTAPIVVNGIANPVMDNFTYRYADNQNRLNKVFDAAGDIFAETGIDIKFNSSPGEVSSYNISNTATHNYEYDKIGQLVKDKAENLTIKWRVDGKVKSVTKGGDVTTFIYDGLGNRIAKRKSYLYGSNSTTDYYARDAQGNVMGMYKLSESSSRSNLQKTLYLNEHHIFGSSRLGLEAKYKLVYKYVKPSILMKGTADTKITADVVAKAVTNISASFLPPVYVADLMILSLKVGSSTTATWNEPNLSNVDPNIKNVSLTSKFKIDQAITPPASTVIAQAEVLGQGSFIDSNQTISNPTLTGFVNVTVDSAGKISKTGASAADAGGETGNILIGNGYVERKVLGTLPSHDGIMLGLSYQSNASLAPSATINYGLNTNASAITIYETNVQKAIPATTIGFNDLLKVERINGQIKYYKNSTLLLTTAEPALLAGQPMLVDFSMSVSGTSIYNLKIVKYDAPYVNTDQVISNPALKAMANVTVTAGVISNPTIAVAGGETAKILSGDGYVERTISGTLPSNSGITLGLSYQTNSNLTASNTITYGLNTNGTIVIYENGVTATGLPTAAGSYQVGDVVKVERINGKIKYYKNGIVLRTVTETAANFGLPMLVDFSMSQVNTSIYNLKVVNYSDSYINTNYTNPKPAVTASANIAIDAAGTITKISTTSSFDAGGESDKILTGDGFVERVVGGATLASNNNVMLGLSYASTPTNVGYARINYALYTYPTNTLIAFESGTQVNLPVTGGANLYALTNILKIERINGKIKYYKNNILLRTVNESPANLGLPMLVNFSMSQYNTGIYGLKVTNYKKPLQRIDGDVKTTMKLSAEYLSAAGGTFKPKVIVTKEIFTNGANTKKEYSLASTLSITSAEMASKGMEVKFDGNFNQLGLDKLSGTIVVNGVLTQTFNAVAPATTTPVVAVPVSKLGSGIFDVCSINYSFGSQGSTVSREFDFNHNIGAAPVSTLGNIAMAVTPPAVRGLGPCLSDSDTDGIFDVFEDADGNGNIADDDTDSDGVINYMDTDDDGDGILTKWEETDTDGNPATGTIVNHDGTAVAANPSMVTDGIPDYLDEDDDGDGYPTWQTQEGGPGVKNSVPGLAYTLDSDGDTFKNYLDCTNGLFPVTEDMELHNFVNLIGDKRYELANHLGNVLVVINDKKIPELELPSSILKHFNADVLSYSDYYPFGMLVPGRHATNIPNGHRYGF
ncbi:hypothetical protein EKL32_18115, partial [Flavobacterium sp. GSN2]